MAWSEISLFREPPVSRLLRLRFVRPVASLLNLIVSQQQGIPLLEVIGTVDAVAGNADMGFIMGLGGEPVAQRVPGSMLENVSPQRWQISQGWISPCACCPFVARIGLS